jgi:hypothetical protein
MTSHQNHKTLQIQVAVCELRNHYYQFIVKILQIGSVVEID